MIQYYNQERERERERERESREREREKRKRGSSHLTEVRSHLMAFSVDILVERFPPLTAEIHAMNVFVCYST